MKKFSVISLCTCLPLLLTGCSAIGSKSGSMIIMYTATAIVSFLLLVGYCCLIRKKETWFLLLFSSVFLVNLGYLTLALSGTLEEALLANRLAYLGSVCLPMSMLMIIMNVCGLKYRKWFPGLLLGVGTAVFLIAASPGYLDVYYSEVSLSTVNGVSVLKKVYGPWHCVYLFYLLAYFAVTAAAVAQASVKKKVDSPLHAVILATVVFINMGVWLLEQLVQIDFELLSVSYILSELFLLGLDLMLQERTIPSRTPAEANMLPVPEIAEPDADVKPEADISFAEKCEYFAAQLPCLTPTEHVIYEYYIAGTGTKEIMSSLSIKENTLKYHNKNIYGKLGVSSRKELMEIAAALKDDQRD